MIFLKFHPHTTIDVRNFPKEVEQFILNPFDHRPERATRNGRFARSEPWTNIQHILPLVRWVSRMVVWEYLIVFAQNIAAP